MRSRLQDGDVEGTEAGGLLRPTTTRLMRALRRQIVGRIIFDPLPNRPPPGEAPGVAPSGCGGKRRRTTGSYSTSDRMRAPLATEQVEAAGRAAGRGLGRGHGRRRERGRSRGRGGEGPRGMVQSRVSGGMMYGLTLLMTPPKMKTAAVAE